MTITKRDPVKLLNVSVRCPTTGKIVKVLFKRLSFRGWERKCITCGDHGGVDMDIGICPSCGDTHPVTILMEY
jgi:rRNA maturation endonuclease Nob1